MSKFPRCSCGLTLTDGRCPATPSCDEFRKPHVRLKHTNVIIRERKNESRRMSLTQEERKRSTAAYAKLSPYVGQQVEKARERAARSAKSRGRNSHFAAAAEQLKRE